MKIREISELDRMLFDQGHDRGHDPEQHSRDFNRRSDKNRCIKSLETVEYLESKAFLKKNADKSCRT